MRRQEQPLSHRELNLATMMSTRPRRENDPTVTMTRKSEVVVIGSAQSKPQMAATITPTSTPPIRFTQTTRSRDETISPSPLDTEAQRRYYADSTWRMYDRIHTARPPKNCVIPSLSSRPSSMTSMPRFPPRQLDGSTVDNAAEDYPPAFISDYEEEMIFDLEL